MPTVMGPPRPKYWIARGWSLRYTKKSQEFHHKTAGEVLVTDVIILLFQAFISFYNLSTLVELLRFPAPPAPAHHWNRHPAPMIERVPFHAAWASMFNASREVTNIIMLHHVYKNGIGISISVVN